MSLGSVFNLCSIQWFIIGLLYMDFRADHLILSGKTSDENLLAAFYHYHIADMTESWYRVIMLSVFGLGFIIIFIRVVRFGSIWDYLQLITACVNGAIFGVLIIPQRKTMSSMKNVETPQEYLQYLQIMAQGHCLIGVLSAVALFLAYLSYNAELKMKKNACKNENNNKNKGYKENKTNIKPASDASKAYAKSIKSKLQSTKKKAKKN